MSVSEFECINRYFTGLVATPATDPLIPQDTLVRGIGDDAALIESQIESNPKTTSWSSVITVDTLVADRHFFAHEESHAIGYKALAVNLSDLAAMGAVARWYTLALTLPEIDEAWLTGFRAGLNVLTQEHGLALIGGDTTRGPLTITIQAMGVVETASALRRDRAQVGDSVYVTGALGAAAFALRALNPDDPDLEIAPEHLSVFLPHLRYPTPRLAAGRALMGLAHAAVDLSDGLLGDIAHIATQSAVGIELNCERLPIHPLLNNYLSPKEAMLLALTGGDDYELCFTAPAELEETLFARFHALGLPVTCVGHVVEGAGVTCVRDGKPWDLSAFSAFQHF